MFARVVLLIIFGFLALSEPVLAAPARSTDRCASASRRKPAAIKHVVRQGDTLSSLAEKYAVSVRDIQRWNRMSSDTIYVGRKLTIHSNVPVRPTREVVYIVQPGDTLGEIAEKFDCSVRELKALNRIRNARSLQVGKALKVRQQGPEEDSEAVGRPNRGRLVKGEQLSLGGAWYRVRRENTAWGTNETITQLQRAITRVNTDKKLRKRKKKIPPIVIGDISRQTGGELLPHKSHQNGRDVDLGYFHRGMAPEKFVKASRSNIDLELTWALIDAFLDADAVEYIFIDRKLQRWLYDWALDNKKASKKALDAIFQVGGRGGAVIRHEPGHLNHMHIRFRCPSTDESCS